MNNFYSYYILHLPICTLYRKEKFKKIKKQNSLFWLRKIFFLCWEQFFRRTHFYSELKEAFLWFCNNENEKATKHVRLFWDKEIFRKQMIRWNIAKTEELSISGKDAHPFGRLYLFLLVVPATPRWNTWAWEIYDFFAQGRRWKLERYSWYHPRHLPPQTTSGDASEERIYERCRKFMMTFS